MTSEVQHQAEENAKMMVSEAIVRLADHVCSPDFDWQVVAERRALRAAAQVLLDALPDA